MTTDLLVSRLCHLYGLGHAVLTGRARAGLLALGEVLGLAGRPAVIPSNLCPVVPVALHAAGLRLRLAPVSPCSGLADDDRLVRAMAAGSPPGLVMPSHLYGQHAAYPLTCAEAARGGWFVLENDTLLAARARGGCRPAFGAAVLTSFGHAKTAPAGGGGAVLTDDAALAAELRRVIAGWPVLGAAAAAVEQHTMALRRHLRQLGCAGLAEGLMAVEQAQLRHAFPPALAPAVLAALDGVEARLERRAAVATAWADALAPFRHQLRTPRVAVTAPWRLIRSVPQPGLRDRLVARLRAQGFDAGTNFPALTEAFPHLLAGQGHADADAWSATVLNLWLDEAVTPARLQAAVDCIAEVLDSTPARADEAA